MKWRERCRTYAGSGLARKLSEFLGSGIESERSRWARSRLPRCNRSGMLTLGQAADKRGPSNMTLTANSR
jgi:hypothetical protein